MRLHPLVYQIYIPVSVFCVPLHVYEPHQILHRYPLLPAVIQQILSNELRLQLQLAPSLCYLALPVTLAFCVCTYHILQTLLALDSLPSEERIVLLYSRLKHLSYLLCTDVNSPSSYLWFEVLPLVVLCRKSKPNFHISQLLIKFDLLNKSLSQLISSLLARFLRLVLQVQISDCKRWCFCLNLQRNINSLFITFLMFYTSSSFYLCWYWLMSDSLAYLRWFLRISFGRIFTVYIYSLEYLLVDASFFVLLWSFAEWTEVYIQHLFLLLCFLYPLVQ